MMKEKNDSSWSIQVLDPFLPADASLPHFPPFCGTASHSSIRQHHYYFFFFISVESVHQKPSSPSPSPSYSGDLIKEQLSPMLHSIHSSAKILPFYLKIVRVKCSGRTVAGRRNATYGVHRLLSTSSKGGSNLAASSASGEDGQSITLYERDSNRNNTPRASFLVSSVNCIYWIW